MTVLKNNRKQPMALGPQKGTRGARDSGIVSNVNVYFSNISGTFISSGQIISFKFIFVLILNDHVQIYYLVQFTDFSKFFNILKYYFQEVSQNLNFEIMLRAARLIDNSDATVNGEEYKILSDLYNTHLNLCNGDPMDQDQNGVDIINHTEVANMC